MGEKMSYIEVMINLTRFTIRPTKRELPRLEAFVEEVQKRYRGQVATARILKELMGLRPPGVLDPEEIQKFHEGAVEKSKVKEMDRARKKRLVGA